jgi:uncharacterized protein YegL
MNSNLTEILVVIDKSGSMSHLRGDTIKGFNKFLHEQQEAPGEANMTIVLFDTKTKVLVNGKDIKDVRDLTDESYFPDGGTALYDAVGMSMAKVGERLAKLPEEKRPGRVLVAVLTDGEENSSKEYSLQAVTSAIKHQEEKYPWTFMFLAAGMGAFGEAQKMGFSKGATVAFANNAGNTAAAYGTVSAMAMSYRTTDMSELKEFSRGMNLTAAYTSNGGEALEEAGKAVSGNSGVSRGMRVGQGMAQMGVDWSKLGIDLGANGGAVDLGTLSTGTITTTGWPGAATTDTVLIDPNVQSTLTLNTADDFKTALKGVQDKIDAAKVTVAP